MIKLLRANFARMFRSRFYILCLIVGLGFNAFITIDEYFGLKHYTDSWIVENYTDMEESIEAIRSFNNYEHMMGNVWISCIFLIPAFIGFFIGTDYSDGTIRNKIMVGHRRGYIYLSNFITVLAGSEIIYLGSLTEVYILGRCLFKYSYHSGEEILEFVLIGALIMAAVAAVITFVAMLVRSKAGGGVCSVTIAFAMVVCATMIEQALNQPEYYNKNCYWNSKIEQYYELPASLEELSLEELEEYGITQADFEYMEPMQQKNPGAVSGIKRKVYTFLDKTLPGNQLYSASQWQDERYIFTICSDIILIIALTAAGIFIFRKRNLK